MISRSWFGRSNARESDENAATAHPAQTQPLTPTCEGTGPDPVSPESPGRPGLSGSAQPSAAERTVPSDAGIETEIEIKMDGMSELELLDFLERQVRHFDITLFWLGLSRFRPLYAVPRHTGCLSVFGACLQFGFTWISLGFHLQNRTLRSRATPRPR